MNGRRFFPGGLALTALALGAGGCRAGTVGDAIFADGFDDNCNLLTYAEGFLPANGSPWPAPWTVAGNVASADVQGGQARLRPGPTNYSLARMKAPIASANVELRFLFRMEDAASQGVGFYVRQNGGYLTQTMPAGQGYAVFVEGTFRNMAGIGVWKEENGNEIQLGHSLGLPGPSAGNNYRVRFQVFQLNPTTTQLQAKFWLDGSTEPAGWQALMSDNTSVLQNVSGGLAVDSWSVFTSPTPISAHTFVDDIQLQTLCPP